MKTLNSAILILLVAVVYTLLLIYSVSSMVQICLVLAGYVLSTGFLLKWSIDSIKRECDEECGLVTTQLQTNDEDPETTTTDY